jgi:hypothetical protein
MFTFSQLLKRNNGLQIINAIITTGKKYNLKYVIDYENYVENELYDENGNIIDLVIKM